MVAASAKDHKHRVQQNTKAESRSFYCTLQHRFAAQVNVWLKLRHKCTTEGRGGSDIHANRNFAKISALR